MTVDWASFTPFTATLGGLLIGVAAVVFIHVNGRIAGISGIVGGMLRPSAGDFAWRAAFIAGLIAAPLSFELLAAGPVITIDATYPVLSAAGALVGFGTRLGSGCTSGHGVCGLSRLSPRSLAATATFMAAGFLTVYVLRHTLG